MQNPLDDYIDRIVTGDCLTHLANLPPHSVHCFVSDIPYGINLNAWDVLHQNTNSGLLGQSPAQIGKRGFQRRGKPIRGWNHADRSIPREYQAWCAQWGALIYPTLMDGASLFVFGARRMLHRAVIALEDCGFLLRDILAWEKPSAHHRAQRLSVVLERRGLLDEAERWQGWRLGNLAPRWEPIAWLFKPYPRTVTDAVLDNGVGAVNLEACLIDGKAPSNLVNFRFEPDEPRIHEAQKPVQLVEFLIKLTTREGQIVLDPFIGSGTTAVACRRLRRHYVGFEIEPDYVLLAEDRLRRLR
jgi:site-specific DNA-methyltransferase (adenine-specific)